MALKIRVRSGLWFRQRCLAPDTLDWGMPSAGDTELIGPSVGLLNPRCRSGVFDDDEYLEAENVWFSIGVSDSKVYGIASWFKCALYSSVV